MIIAHIPPGMFEKHRSWRWYFPEYNNRFNEILRAHATVISSVNTAHHHTDSFKILYNENGVYSHVDKTKQSI